ncbi:hypothetical protein X801_10432, partial [Opisthorchis viverrini]
MTAVSVELRLQLAHFLDSTDQCTKGAESVKKTESSGSKQTPFHSESPILRKILLDRCLRLFLIGLDEMNRTDDENSEHSSQPLAEYLEDNLAERLWIQLCDLGEVLRTELNRFSRGAVRLIDRTNWNSSTVSTTSFTRDPTSPNSVRDVELIALLITGYLRWIVLYYKTHREGILVQHVGEERVKLLSQLQQRLVKESLNPAMETLCTLLLGCRFTDKIDSASVERFQLNCPALNKLSTLLEQKMLIEKRSFSLQHRHIYFSNDASTDIQFNRLIGHSLSSLASLFTLFPGLPVVPVTSFSRSDRTLFNVILHWIASTLRDRPDHRWNSQSNTLVATLVILNSMLLLEPKQSDYLVNVRQELLSATDLGDRLLSAVPQTKTKLSGSMLELCGEVLVLSVCYVREVLHSEQLSQNREHLKGECASSGVGYSIMLGNRNSSILPPVRLRVTLTALRLTRLMSQLNSYVPVLQERFENSEDSSSTLSRLTQ